MTRLSLVPAAALCASYAFGQTAIAPGDAPIQVVSHPAPPTTQFLQKNAGWQALPAQQGMLPFTDTKSKGGAIVGNVTHQDPQTGAWVQNDPSLSSTANGWRIDGTANQVLVQKTAATAVATAPTAAAQHVVTQTYTDYTTKHNSVLAVTLPVLTYSSGFTFNFTQDGLNWDLRFLQSGFFEFGTTVTKKLGAATHSFTVSSSETLTVNTAGQLVGNANVGLNRAVMLPRFGKAVPCSAWSYSSKTGVASFTCDDSGFKANQLPYRIDPQSFTLTDTNDTFSVDAYDDGQGDSGSNNASTQLSICCLSSPIPPTGAYNLSTSCSFTTDWASLDSGDTINCWFGPIYQYSDVTVNIGIGVNNSAPYSDSAMVSDVQYVLTWTMPPPPTVSVSPASGSLPYGNSETFTINAVPGSPPCCYQGFLSISSVTLNFGGTGSTGTCSINVVPVSNGLGGSYPGLSGSPSNSQCSIGSVSGSINQLYINEQTMSFQVTVTFTSAFLGSRAVWVTATDNDGDTEPWTQVGTWTVTNPTIAAPSFSPGGGTYSAGQSVALSDSTSGATIRYTTDGSTPTAAYGTVYGGTPVSVTGSLTIKALAYATGYINNSSSATYTIVYPGAPITGSGLGPTNGVPAADSGNGLDPRRVGIRALGAYWGASGENIDTTSANLNFSTPLIKPVGRGSWSIPFILSYNSQMWRQDSGGTWLLGQDTGYGMGWKLQAGSITPIWTSATQFSHYLYTDATGAEYSLSVSTNNVWTSVEGVYISYDATANRLYSPDGSFWYMGCQSSANEQDAGTLYPTLIEDTNGNEIMILYEAGNGAGATNSSARIAAIYDPRAGNNPTYTFNYNSDAIPHLVSISAGGILVPGEAWQFTYNSISLTDPFASAAHGSTALLATAQQTPIISGGPGPSSFTYDTHAELTQYTTPMGGSLSWTYQNFTYNGNIQMNELATRGMNDSAASLTNTWTLSHGSGDNTRTYHALTYIIDTGASSQKIYGSGVPSTGGSLVVPVCYAEANSSGSPDCNTAANAIGSSVLLLKAFTWTQNAAGNAYVGSVTSTLSPSTSGAASTTTTQTLDIYGNLTQQVVNDYSGITPASNTYNFTYLNSSNYTSIYIRNRLTQATVTGYGGTLTLASNTYDGTGLGALLDPTQNNGSNFPSGQPTPTYHDANYGLSFTTRGNPTVTNQYGTVTNTAYLTTGVPYEMSDGDGMVVSVASSSSTAYSLPSTVTPNSNGSLATSMSYTSAFALTSVTGPNGVTQSVNYDLIGRPANATSADGAITTYTYNYLPNTQTATISTTTNGNTTTQWKKTTYDGFGRTISVVTGHDSTPVTEVDTQYGACGCSPLGKVTATSMPYAAGGTPSWTTNTYDTSGRTIKQTKPDGSFTTTSYAGNLTTVTDPAGKWKTYYSNASGGLVAVVEPDPNNATPSSNPFTYYYLNGAGQIAFVGVQRGSVDQYRTFTWGGSDLTSSNDPETGTTTYQYDGNHHVTLRTDAKGQQTRYTYDSYERLIEVQYYAAPTCQYCTPQENTAQRVQYGYDVNPHNYNDYYTSGRLTQVGFGGGNYAYYYDYNQAGRVTGNQFQAYNGGSVMFNLQATYAWDNQGRMTSMSYPSGTQLAYQYDAVGRLNQITSPNSNIVSVSAAYNGASQLSQLNYGGYGPIPNGYFGATTFSESRSYNTLMQLTNLTTTLGQGSSYGTVVNMQYNYTAGQNNGRVAQTVDGVLGETVNYTYDMWNRLTAASATNGNWGEQYTFDNFGNLTGKTPSGSGSAPAMNVPASLSTNQPTGLGSYDANGSPLGTSNAGSGTPGYLWDGENRLMTDQTAILTPTNYIYDPWGRRVWKQTCNYCGVPYNGTTTGEIYFYGATGQKLETYSFTEGQTYNNGAFTAGLEGTNVYFGGKLLQSKGVWVATDRLGSVRATSNGAGDAMSYWPYGEERTNTANGREKFGTYTRDGNGQDYAEQRYYNANMGAFWSPDPGGIKTARPGNPSSWNRYVYVGGDPVNKGDPRGYCSPEDDPPCYGTTVTAEAPPEPIDDNDNDGSGGPSTSSGDQDGDYGGEEYIPSIATAGQAKQGLIQAFSSSSFSNCATVMGGVKSVDAAVNNMTFLDGTGSGSMNAAGGSDNRTFAQYSAQYQSTFAATLNNSSGGISNTVVLFANFFGNVAGGYPNPLFDQDVTLIHEFMHATFKLDHDALVKKFGITVIKGQSATAALNAWITNDCKNN